LIVVDSFGLDREPAQRANTRRDAAVRVVAARTADGRRFRDGGSTSRVPGTRRLPQAAASRIERNLRQHVVQRMVSQDIAVKAASNFRTMRGRSFTVGKTIDLLIGTFCIERGHRLLHDDRDYGPMENLLGLTVVR
jgi:hypothetical protein